MTLSDEAAGLLRAVLAEREALVDRATDKVFYDSPDLAGKRSRLVTRMLVDRVFACSEAVLLRGDEGPLEEFIDQVTGIRAEPDFHVSTLLTGFRSFRQGIEARVRERSDQSPVVWELMTAADDLYARSACRAADMLVDRQHAALHSRRGQVERENIKLMAELKAAKEAADQLRAELDAGVLSLLRVEQELNEKIALIGALTEGDRVAREILGRLPPGPARLDALRELRRAQLDKIYPAGS